MNEKTTAQLLDELTQSSVKTADLSSLSAAREQIAALESEIDALPEIRNTWERTNREKILRSTLATILESHKKNVEDSASSLRELEERASILEKSFKDLMAPLPEDAARIAVQKRRAEEAEENLAKASGATWFKERRTTNAREQLALEQTALKELQNEIKTATRERLNSRDLPKSMEAFKKTDARVTANAEKGLAQIKLEVAAIKADMENAFNSKIEAQKLMAKLDAELATAKAELDRETSALNQMAENTTERQLQDKHVADLRVGYQALEGKRNGAYTVLTTKEEWARSHQIMLETQMKAEHVQLIWIMNAKSKAKHRDTFYHAWLTLLQTASEQELMQGANKVGSEMDLRGTQYAAETMEAMQRQVVEMLNGVEHEVVARRDIQKAQTESGKRFTTEIEREIARFKEMYPEDKSLDDLGITGERAEEQKASAASNDDILSMLK